jgi:hypothetical protein
MMRSTRDRRLRRGLAMVVAVLLLGLTLDRLPQFLSLSGVCHGAIVREFRTLFPANALAMGAVGGGYDLWWCHVGGGAGQSAGGGRRLAGSSGQAATAELSAGGYRLQGGFFAPEEASRAAAGRAWSRYR